MEDQSRIIITAIIIGFIIGYKFYCWFGWKPEDPSPTTESFILVSKIGCGFMGLILGIFLSLGITVSII